VALEENAMYPTNFHDDILPQDTSPGDASEDVTTGQPLSLAELDELLYGGERSSEERLELLRALREDTVARQGGDIADDDAIRLIGQIDDRIAELEGAERQGAEPGALDTDPLAHRETLAPDSDELEALEEAEAASLDEEDEWLDEEEEEEERIANSE
jgi:hypothetical protein